MSESKPAGAPEMFFGWACALVAFLLPLLSYLATLAPTVLPYDSGMLQAKAYVLGIGHPTGYPTFILLGKLFSYLPFGDVAYRVNLSSAVYAALASFFVYLAARRLIPAGPSASDRVLAAAASLLAALSFAASPALWSQAVVAEVYTLNALLIAATLHALLAWRETGRERWLLLTAFLAGLAATAHMTSALLLPAALVFVVLARAHTLKDPATLLGASTAYVAGLCPYLYLPLRASMNPPLDFGSTPSTLEGFFFMLSGGPYKGQMFAFGPSEFPDRLAMYLGLLVGQYPLPLLAAAIAGGGILLRADRAALALLGVFGLGSLTYSLEYDIHDIAVYFVPSYLLIALLVAVGLHSLAAAARALLGRVSPAHARYAAPLILVPALLALALSVPETRRLVDQSENFAARSLIGTVVQETLPNSTVFGGRSLSALYYAQFVEGRRPDLRPRMVFETEAIVGHLRFPPQKRRIVYLVQVDPTYAEDTGYLLEPVRTSYTEGLERAGYHPKPVAENLYRVEPTFSDSTAPAPPS